MLRKLGAALVLVLCVGIALADEINAVILKVDGDKVTFAEMKGKEKGPEKTLPVAANVKVVKGKYNKETKKLEDLMDVEGGLKNDAFSNISEKGVRATLVTNDDNTKITEVRMRSKKK